MALVPSGTTSPLSTPAPSRRATPRRHALPGLLATLALLLAALWPGVASAHAGLVGSDPEEGATLDAAPRQVTLSFNEDIGEPAFVVVRADGADVAQGDPQVDGGTVTQAVRADAAGGEWTLAYRVVSADGHPVTGEIGFEVAASAPVPESEESPAQEPTDEPTEEPAVDDAAPQAAQTPGQDGFWARHAEHVLVGAVLLALAGAVLVIARRRSA